MNVNKIKNMFFPFIINVHFFDEIDSTHLYSKRLLNKNIHFSNIIIAKTQTNGIGSHQNTWYSGKDNLAFTLILFPECHVCKLSNITLLIADSIKQSIFDLYGYNLEIKIPNDLFLNNKKICRNPYRILYYSRWSCKILIN